MEYFDRPGVQRRVMLASRLKALPIGFGRGHDLLLVSGKNTLENFKFIWMRKIDGRCGDRLSADVESEVSLLVLLVGAVTAEQLSDKMNWIRDTSPWILGQIYWNFNKWLGN